MGRHRLMARPPSNVDGGRKDDGLEQSSYPDASGLWSGAAAMARTRSNGTTPGASRWGTADLAFYDREVGVQEYATRS